MDNNNTLFNKTNTNYWFGGIIVSIFLLFGTWVSVTHGWFPLFDYLNLIFHEAGHWIWGIFGEMMGFLGGSLNQAFIPLLYLVALAFKRKWFSAVACLWWLGQNLINVSVYIGDARTRSLELLGGDNVVHD